MGRWTADQALVRVNAAVEYPNAVTAKQARKRWLERAARFRAAAEALEREGKRDE